MSFSRAVTFLWWASLRNRARKQLERMRQPKYLAGLIVGGAYLYMMVVRRLSYSRSVESLPPDARSLAELSLGTMVMMSLAAAWMLGQDRPSLAFTETEVQQLFSAPISRRELLHYKLARGVMGAGVSSLFTTIFIGRAVTPHWGLFFLGSVLAFVTVNLHVTAASFVRTRLARLGGWGTVLRWAVLLGLFAALAWAGYLAFQAHPFPLGAEHQEPTRDWLFAFVSHPALQVALWPGRVLVAPALAEGVGAFLLTLPIVLGLLAVHYLWITVLLVPFEEAVVVRAEESAKRRSQRVARVGHIVMRRPFFRLSASGRPEVALLWKNLIAARRISGPEVLLVLAVLGLAVPLGVAVFSPAALPSTRQIMAGVYLTFAAILTVFGPVSMRSDLRLDLPKLDLLRALPLTGWQVVAAEVLAPGVLLAVMQWVLLLLATVMGVGAPGAWGARVWVAGALGLAPLLPALAIGGVFVQNAAVVLFPAWLPADGERARGIEALGQRLLTLAGALVVLLGGLLPALILASLVGFALYGLLDVWALPCAGLVAAAGLALEVALGVMALGRAFDRMDVSSEGVGAP